MEQKRTNIFQQALNKQWGQLHMYSQQVEDETSSYQFMLGVHKSCSCFSAPSWEEKSGKCTKSAEVSGQWPLTTQTLRRTSQRSEQWFGKATVEPLQANPLWRRTSINHQFSRRSWTRANLFRTFPQSEMMSGGKCFPLPHRKTRISWCFCTTGFVSLPLFSRFGKDSLVFTNQHRAASFQCGLSFYSSPCGLREIITLIPNHWGQLDSAGFFSAFGLHVFLPAFSPVRNFTVWKTNERNSFQYLHQVPHPARTDLPPFWCLWSTVALWLYSVEVLWCT